MSTLKKRPRYESRIQDPNVRRSLRKALVVSALDAVPIAAGIFALVEWGWKPGLGTWIGLSVIVLFLAALWQHQRENAGVRAQTKSTTSPSDSEGGVTHLEDASAQFNGVGQPEAPAIPSFDPSRRLPTSASTPNELRTNRRSGAGGLSFAYSDTRPKKKEERTVYQHTADVYILEIKNWEYVKEEERWRCRIKQLRFRPGPLIDQDILLRNDVFKPDDTEVEIRYALLSSPWEWRIPPIQSALVAAVVATLFTILLETFAPAKFEKYWGVTPIMLSMGVIVGVILAIRPAFRRHFTPYIATNLRFLRLYVPPMIWTEDRRAVPLRRLDGISCQASMWGRTLNYGKARSETSAEKSDKWLLDELQYIQYYKDFSNLSTSPEPTM